jgi:hypothetical protein
LRIPADTLTLRKRDGTEHAGIKAFVSEQSIGLFDVSLYIEPNDVLLRTLPNGQTEEFIVEHAVLSRAFDSIPAEWKIKHRCGHQAPKAPLSMTSNVSGQKSRIIGSHDQSTNVAHAEF